MEATLISIATTKRLMRFGLVGGGATLLYGVLSIIFVRGYGISAMASHLLAYALIIPLSFMGQKRITFGYQGPQGKAFGRFVITSVVALCLSSLAVWGVQRGGLAPIYGTVATMAIVPVISYLMMAFWVFWEQSDA